MNRINTAKVRANLTAIEAAQENAAQARAHETRVSASVLAQIDAKGLSVAVAAELRHEEENRTATIHRMIDAQELREVGAARTEAIKELLLVREQPVPAAASVPRRPWPPVLRREELGPKESYYLHNGL
jgi:hypothetical protein